MPIFDGDNLVMTLDAVTSQDVINDWYEPWKDWMLASPLNRRYPQLFFSEAGAPATATLDQGAYIRVNNTVGWRIRPPEQDIEINYTGNLLRLSQNLPIFIPTIGNFSTHVFNTQPISTQVISGSGVTEQDKTDIITGVLTDAMTEAYPVDGQSAMTLTQAQYAMVQLLTEFARTGATISVKKRDGTTEAMELTLDSGTAPTSSTQSG
jgi:hypothetical protein